MNNTLLKDYMDYLTIEKKYSPHTILAYQNDLVQFEKASKKEFTYIQKEDIVAFLETLKKKNYQTSTIAHYITSIKEFYKFLEREEVIPKNPTLSLELPKVRKQLPSVLTEEEVIQILDIPENTCYAIRNKAMLEVMYATGIRVSELLNIQTHDINLEEETLKVMGKGRKERLLPLGDYAIFHIKKYLENARGELLKKKTTDFLFLNSRGEKLSRQSFFKMVKEQADKKCIQKELSPHTLRHSFATHLLKHGADIRSIQELLGHASVSTTQIYTHIVDEKLKSDYENHHPHGKEKR